MPSVKRSTNTALMLIFLILLLDVIGLSILYPVSAYIVRRYSDDAQMVTLLTMIYAAAQFFAAPLFGKLGDRYGRRPVLLVSVFGSALGYLLFGVGGALWVLFLSRLIDGITAGNQAVAAAYIADSSTPRTSTQNFTLIGMAWGVGLVVGPAIGAALGQVSLVAPVWIAAGLSLFSLLCSYYWLPESLPTAQRSTAALAIADFNPLATIGSVVRYPGLGRLIASFCLFNFTFSGINSIETLFLIEKFGAQPWQIGVLLVLAGLTIIGVQRIVQKLVKWRGEQPLAVGGLLTLASGVLATSTTPLLWPVYPLMVLRTIASGCIFPTMNAQMSKQVSAQEQGELMGVNTALSSLMSILGPLWAGAVYEYSMPSAPYWMGAGLLVGAAFILFEQSRRRCPIHHS